MTKVLSFIATAFAVLAFMVVSAAAANPDPMPVRASNAPVYHWHILTATLKPSRKLKPMANDQCEVRQMAWSPLPNPIRLGGGVLVYQMKFLLWAPCWTIAPHNWKWNFSFPGSNYAAESATDVFPVVDVPDPNAQISGTITVGAPGKTSATCKFSVNAPDPPRLPGEPIFPPHDVIFCK